MFGGSFDPIHLGHLLLAETAWEELGLERLLFVPAQRSPWKGGTSASSEMRLTMVELAIRNRASVLYSRYIKVHGKLISRCGTLVDYRC